MRSGEYGGEIQVVLEHNVVVPFLQDCVLTHGLKPDIFSNIVTRHD
jgi:hypothetical protein